LKEDFNAVAPKFLEILLKDASVEVKVNFEDGALPLGTGQEKNTFDFKIRGMENPGRISLNTSELEQKISAFQHILKVASAMGTSFEPYVTKVLPILQSHMNYTSRTLRKFALKTFQYLIKAQGEPNNLTLFSSIYDLFALGILKANKDQDTKQIKLLFEELFHCMKAISENEQPENRFPF